MTDDAVQDYYTNRFDEGRRLTTRSPQGRLEFARVQEIVRARLPARARIADIGGGTGIHAAALAADGHHVDLLDPVARHVEEAAAHGTFRARVGDARDLPYNDDSFDVALLFGPLYHLRTRDDRLRALREAIRVVRPGGTVHAQAIPRHLAHAALTIGRDTVVPSALLADGDPTGLTISFPGRHFHTAASLEQEMTDAGLTAVSVVGVEGPAGYPLEMLSEADEDLHAAALLLARATAHLPRARDLSNHLLATGTVSAAPEPPAAAPATPDGAYRP